jgi:leucyl aminopeptidase
LCLAAELEPDAIVDVATLTGYARVLGTHVTPVMSNDDLLADRISVASSATGERTWRLPVLDDFVEALESPWADLRNIPDPDDAGTTAPAVFLRHFVDGRPWAHLDIGETGFATKTQGETVKGCTGVMARTLVELARRWA